VAEVLPVVIARGLALGALSFILMPLPFLLLPVAPIHSELDQAGRKF
jgi:riboflavin transporter FmnP